VAQAFESAVAPVFQPAASEYSRTGEFCPRIAG
jgi:hypothetical protein